MKRQVIILVRKFGFQEVETGFSEAMIHKRTTLAYVRGVCTKRQEKTAIEKSREEAAKKKKELDDIISSDRKSGKKLNLVEMVYGSKQPAAGIN